MTSRFVSSRQGRSFGPSRGKMGARSGARSHTVVVDDHRSMNKTRLVRDEGLPHAQSERANQSEAPPRQRANRPDRPHAHQKSSLKRARPVRANARTENNSSSKREKQLEPPFRRARPVRHSSQSDSPKRRTNRPCSFPFYNPRMQISGSRGQVGGATLAHWSGEKEACISPDPDIRTRGSAIFP